VEHPVLEMKNITKTFGSFKALNNVSLTLNRGEVLGFIGENGAGKSTLMKILSGLYTKDSGEILINGEQVEIDSVETSHQKGISTIYQELSLIPSLNVAENIFITREMTDGKSKGYLNRLKIKEMEKRGREILTSMDVDIDVKTSVEQLNLGQRQTVEIARALSTDAKIIIMDEPTAALENKEREILFDNIRKLKKNDVSVIYVSHALDEIMKICDKVLIIRDGKVVSQKSVSDINVAEIISLMIGKSLEQQYIKRKVELGDEILKVKHLEDGKNYFDVSFNLRKGEIIGFAGLDGCGKNEVARTLFGLNTPIRGQVFLNKKPYQVKSPNQAIKKGLAFLPAERKTEGILSNQDIKWNTTIAKLERIYKGCQIQSKDEKVYAQEYIDTMNIKVKNMNQEIVELSGGNQQKVMVARWLFIQPEIIVFEEPTRGIDVNAKTEIYEYIMRFVEAGKGVMVVSSEIPELIGICDRIFVMNKGKIVAELDAADTTQNEIKHYSVNI
jgi:ribose transport system ATP-binding protein